MDKIRIGIVDDHQLFLKSLSLMLASFNNYEVVVEALNGKELQLKCNKLTKFPDIMLLDVNMPIMGGIETAQWLSKQFPNIKLVALSMNDDDKTILGMIKSGCCAYLMKDTHPNELEIALNSIAESGYYNTDSINRRYVKLINASHDNGKDDFNVTDREKEFINLASSDLTYGQIATKMEVSLSSIDKMRETLFDKFGVKSRVGLVLESIRKGYINLF